MLTDLFCKNKLNLLAFFLCMLTWLTPGIAAGEAFHTISGRLLERGTKKPLSSVNVFALPSRIKAVTDAEGNFTSEKIPAGPFTWVINLAGYEKLELLAVSDQESSATPQELYLERSSYQVYETTIYGKGQNRDDTTKTLKSAEFLTVPGARGDPIKAAQNLPGIARPAGFSSQVIIQGSAPNDTKYWIDGHEVPIIFHFGGLSSVLTPESIDRVEYLSAGYGPEFGRALGGQVGAWTRSPKRDRMQGFFFLDIFNTGGLLETPVGEKSSLLVSARQSYVGAVLRRVLKNNENLNLTVAPQFSDLSSIYETEISPRDTFKLVAIGSRDELSFLFTQPVNQDPAIRGNFQNVTAFFRVIPQLTHKHSATTISRYSLGVGRDWISVDVGSNYFYLKNTGLSARAELEHKASESWTTYFGLDNRMSWSTVNLRLPSSFNAGGIRNPLSSGAVREADISDRNNQFGFYMRNVLRQQGSRWSFLPGGRVDYFSATKETLPVPRLSTRYDASNYFNVRFSTGLYTQRPSEQETDDVFGNPDIKSSRAAHFALTAEKDFKEGSSKGFTLTGGPFYKYLYNLVVPSSALISRGGTIVAENFANSGSGKVVGAEALLKMNLAPWTGWLSYTLSRSTRTDQRFSDYLFQYDQTHVLTAIGSIDLPGNWKISGRLRYTTGNPSTPITGSAFDSDSDVYVPIRGPYFSQRLSPFYQLDLRIDKKWIYDTWILSLYLDIQNATNRMNPQDIRYSYDYRTSTKVSDLPVLPTFGIKGEF